MNKFFLVLFCIGITTGLFSESEKVPLDKRIKLTVEDAVNMALMNNLSYKSTTYENKASFYKMIASYNKLLPSANISMSLIKSNLSDEDREGSAAVKLPIKIADGVYQAGMVDYTRNAWAAALNVDVTFTANAQIFMSMYQTVLDYQSGKINTEDARLKLIRDIKKSYYNIILLDERLKIKKQELNSKKQRYDQAIINFNNGLIPKLSKLNAQVVYESLKPEVTDMENNYKVTVMSFKQMIGMKDDVNFELGDALVSEKRNVPSEKILSEKYIDKNLTLKSLYYAKLSLENVRNMNIASLTPTFQLAWTADPTFQKDPMEDSWFDDVEDNWKQSSGGLRFTLSVPLDPLVPFSKEQVNIIESQFNVQKMNYNIKNMKQNKIIELKSSIMTLTKIMESLESIKLNVSVADEAHKLSVDAYNKGQQELLDVQDSENNLSNAKFQLLMAEYEYTSALLDLEYLLNMNIDSILNIKGE